MESRAAKSRRLDVVSNTVALIFALASGKRSTRVVVVVVR